MREIGSDEVFRLRDCLLALAEHHNRVSVNFKGHYPKTPVGQTLKRFAEDIDGKKSHIYVIESENRIIGFCKINIDGTSGAIEYLIVLEEYRGQGYGAVLMDKAMSSFSDAGVSVIDVKVADGNSAVSLYEKYGFRMNAHILRLCK